MRIIDWGDDSRKWYRELEVDEYLGVEKILLIWCDYGAKVRCTFEANDRL